MGEKLIFYTFLGFLNSKSYNEFLRSLHKYGDFLKKVLEFQDKETKKLKANSPEKLKQRYESYEKEIKNNILILRENLDQIGFTKDFRTEIKNDTTFCGIGYKTEMLVEVINKFMNFKRSIDLKIQEIESFNGFSESIKKELEKSL